MRHLGYDCRMAEFQPPETHFSTLIAAAITDGLVVLDKHWRYTYVKSGAERLLERSREEFLGRIVWEVYPVELGRFASRRAGARSTTICPSFLKIAGTARIGDRSTKQIGGRRVH